MKRVSVGIIIALALCAGSVTAQQAQGAGAGSGSGSGAGAGQGGATTVQGQAPVTTSQSRGRQTVATTAGAAQGVARHQPVNVRLDITINDQSVGGAPVKKTISLIAADGFGGRVRSTGTLTQEYIQGGMQTPEGKPLVGVRPVGEVQLNIDAHVELLEQDRLRSVITLEYTPGGAAPLPAGTAVTRSPLNQSVTVILQNGKPLVVTQAADPLSDRKITVEVTATILR